MKNLFKNENENYKILSKIKSPSDIKSLSYFDLNFLCEKKKKKIVYTVSRNGGHLASNLGVVELTVALHKEFNTLQDKIVWDTGHQGYTHKLLTGRFEVFDSLKKKGGIGPFINPLESEHDSFIAGHSSISLSAACGLAKAELLKKTKNMVVVVIGDGALTGGIAYEALNNAEKLKNLIIILNCNDMSISKTVGIFHRYLTNIRSNKTYISMNMNLKKILDKIPFFGNFTKKMWISSKETIKKIVYNSNIFSDLGFSFLNYVDGHNLKDVVRALIWAKKVEKPAIIQVLTKKGKGYIYAEKEPELYHGVSPFNYVTGISKAEKSLDFSTVFGKEILELAKKDKRICAITAAMGRATGLFEFEKNFKDRYFDVGIAEEHAVTFAAGLQKGGMIPIFAIYSSFLQRAYDQLLHDVSILNLHVVLAIDRAGISEDGPTHQGIFDVAFLRTIPNITIYSPTTYKELKDMLETAIYKEKGLVAVRYPKGSEIKEIYEEDKKSFVSVDRGEIVLVSYGVLFEEILVAKKKLAVKGIDICCIRIKKIFPIDQELIEKLKQFKEIFFFEEGIKNGGIGEHLFLRLFENGFDGKFNLKAIDGYIKHMSVKEALQELELDSDGIEKEVLKKSYILNNLNINRNFKKHEI